MQRQPEPNAGGVPYPTIDQTAQQQSGFELANIVAILVDNYKLIVGTAIAGLLLGIGVALLTTPKYAATALMQFDPGSSDSLSPQTAQGRYVGPRSNVELIATQIGLLSSDSLARRVAQELNLAANPEYGGDKGTIAQRTDRAGAKVNEMVTPAAVKGSLLITVTAVSTDPAMAARVANSVAQTHIKTSIERKYDASSYARNFLSDQLARTKSALEESDKKLNDYAINAGIFRQSTKDAAGKETGGESLVQSDLTKLNEALKSAEIARIAAEQNYLQSQVDASSDANGAASALVQQRAMLQSEYNEKLATYRPEYPAMQELKAKIDRLDTDINAERKRVSGNKRAELYGQYKAAVRVEAELRQKVGEAKGEVVTDRNRSIQYNILQRESDTNRALYDALLQRYKEVGVTAGIGQSDLTLIDQAKVPSGPFRPRPLVNAILGLVLGLGIGVALAIARQLLFDTVDDAQDVRNKLKLPVLGAIPVEADGRSPMDALADRKSEMSEAYYAARTALKFASPTGMPKSVLVTSTGAGEGKSTSAFALAKSEATLGHRVLLIDGDLRKPTFTSRKDGLGLGNLLTSEDAPETAIESTKTDNLSLLPAGRFSGSEVELLSSNRLPSLIEDLSRKFDLVIVDGPPMLGFADAPLLAAAVEKTLLIFESKRSRIGEAHDMINRLLSSGASIAGVILTKVDLNRSRYGYGYYSYAKSADETRDGDNRTIDAV